MHDCDGHRPAHGTHGLRHQGRLWRGHRARASKDVLPVAVLALWTRHALGRAMALGAAWLCGAAFSCLATHATVTTAISSIERTGTWKMEVRTNAKTELASIEQQLAALSRPAPPRPVKTVREVLAGTSVPAAIWKDSQECAEIQGSGYFARACAQVVQLRRELAASEDYERLSLRAAEMRKALAEAPIVATVDPLPTAFSATLGRLLPIDGMDGVALLLTAVLELISGFGLAALTALYRARDQHRSSRTPEGGSLAVSAPETAPREGASQSVPQQAPSRSQPVSLPKPSLMATALEGGRVQAHPTREASNPPSNILPMRPRPPSQALPEGASLGSQTRPEGGNMTIESHVSVFSGERLREVEGTSIAFSELRSCYEVWCAERDEKPLSLPRFAAAVKALGYEKWKSCGLIRYRGLQLAARSDGSHAVTLHPQLQPAR
jgi:hypothetical protein